MQDYGSSGNKLKRIYDLKVALYHHKTDPATRYQGDPIDIITSSYLRIDVDEFTIYFNNKSISWSISHLIPVKNKAL